MKMNKLFNSLTDSSKVLLVIGGLSLVLDLVNEGTDFYKRLVSGLGMLMWLGILVYQNQCLGPNNCRTYSWLLVILLVIGLLIKMYYVNLKGLSKDEFRKMLDDAEMRERFNGCSRRNGEEHCDTHEGFAACGGNRQRENFTGCSRRSGEEHCDTHEGFAACGGNRQRENFTGCSRRSGEEHCDTHEGFAACGGNRQRENFTGCSRRSGEEHCDTHEGFAACGGNRQRENFTGCSRRSGEEHCDTHEGFFNPLTLNEDEEEEDHGEIGANAETGELFEGFSQSNTST